MDDSVTITAEYEGSNIKLTLLDSGDGGRTDLQYALRVRGGPGYEFDYDTEPSTTRVITFPAFYTPGQQFSGGPFNGPGNTLLRGRLVISVESFFVQYETTWYTELPYVPITGLVPRFPGQELQPLVAVTNVTAQYDSSNIKITLADSVNPVPDLIQLYAVEIFDEQNVSVFSSSASSNLVRSFPAFRSQGNTLISGPLRVKVTVSDESRPALVSEVTNIAVSGTALPPLVGVSNVVAQYFLRDIRVTLTDTANPAPGITVRYAVEVRDEQGALVLSSPASTDLVRSFSAYQGVANTLVAGNLSVKVTVSDGNRQQVETTVNDIAIFRPTAPTEAQTVGVTLDSQLNYSITDPYNAYSQYEFNLRSYLPGGEGRSKVTVLNAGSTLSSKLNLASNQIYTAFNIASQHTVVTADSSGQTFTSNSAPINVPNNILPIDGVLYSEDADQSVFSQQPEVNFTITDYSTDSNYYGDYLFYGGSCTVSGTTFTNPDIQYLFTLSSQPGNVLAVPTVFGTNTIASYEDTLIEGSTSNSLTFTQSNLASFLVTPDKVVRERTYTIAVTQYSLSQKVFSSFRPSRTFTFKPRMQNGIGYYSAEVYFPLTNPSSLPHVVGCSPSYDFSGPYGPVLARCRTIGDNAFSSNSTIQNFNVPSTVERIGSNIFSNGTHLQTLSFSFLLSRSGVDSATAFAGITVDSVKVLEGSPQDWVDWLAARGLTIGLGKISTFSPLSAVTNVTAQAVYGGIRVSWTDDVNTASDILYTVCGKKDSNFAYPQSTKNKFTIIPTSGYHPDTLKAIYILHNTGSLGLSISACSPTVPRTECFVGTTSISGSIDDQEYDALIFNSAYAPGNNNTEVVITQTVLDSNGYFALNPTFNFQYYFKISYKPPTPEIGYGDHKLFKKITNDVVSTITVLNGSITSNSECFASVRLEFPDAGITLIKNRAMSDPGSIYAYRFITPYGIRGNSSGGKYVNAATPSYESVAVTWNNPYRYYANKPIIENVIVVLTDLITGFERLNRADPTESGYVPIYQSYQYVISSFEDENISHTFSGLNRMGTDAAWNPAWGTPPVGFSVNPQRRVLNYSLSVQDVKKNNTTSNVSNIAPFQLLEPEFSPVTNVRINETLNGLVVSWDDSENTGDDLLYTVRWENGDGVPFQEDPTSNKSTTITLANGWGDSLQIWVSVSSSTVPPVETNFGNVSIIKSNSITNMAYTPAPIIGQILQSATDTNIAVFSWSPPSGVTYSSYNVDFEYFVTATSTYEKLGYFGNGPLVTTETTITVPLNSDSPANLPSEYALFGTLSSMMISAQDFRMVVSGNSPNASDLPQKAVLAFTSSVLTDNPRGFSPTLVLDEYGGQSRVRIPKSIIDADTGSVVFKYDGVTLNSGFSITTQYGNVMNGTAVTTTISDYTTVADETTMTYGFSYPGQYTLEIKAGNKIEKSVEFYLSCMQPSETPLTPVRGLRVVNNKCGVKLAWDEYTTPSDKPTAQFQILAKHTVVDGYGNSSKSVYKVLNGLTGTEALFPIQDDTTSVTQPLLVGRLYEFTIEAYCGASALLGLDTSLRSQESPPVSATPSNNFKSKIIYASKKYTSSTPEGLITSWVTSKDPNVVSYVLSVPGTNIPNVTLPIESGDSMSYIIPPSAGLALDNQYARLLQEVVSIPSIQNYPSGLTFTCPGVDAFPAPTVKSVVARDNGILDVSYDNGNGGRPDSYKVYWSCDDGTSGNFSDYVSPYGSNYSYEKSHQFTDLPATSGAGAVLNYSVSVSAFYANIQTTLTAAPGTYTVGAQTVGAITFSDSTKTTLSAVGSVTANSAGRSILEIPSTVTKISNAAFASSNCNEFTLPENVQFGEGTGAVLNPSVQDYVITAPRSVDARSMSFADGNGKLNILPPFSFQNGEVEQFRSAGWNGEINGVSGGSDELPPLEMVTNVAAQYDSTDIKITITDDTNPSPGVTLQYSLEVRDEQTVLVFSSPAGSSLERTFSAFRSADNSVIAGPLSMQVIVSDNNRESKESNLSNIAITGTAPLAPLTGSPSVGVTLDSELNYTITDPYNIYAQYEFNLSSDAPGKNFRPKITTVDGQNALSGKLNLSTGELYTSLKLAAQHTMSGVTGSPFTSAYSESFLPTMIMQVDGVVYSATTEHYNVFSSTPTMTFTKTDPSESSNNYGSFEYSGSAAYDPDIRYLFTRACEDQGVSTKSTLFGTSSMESYDNTLDGYATRTTPSWSSSVLATFTDADGVAQARNFTVAVIQYSLSQKVFHLIGASSFSFTLPTPPPESTPLQPLVSASAKYVANGIEVTLVDNLNQRETADLTYTIVIQDTSFPSQTGSSLVKLFPYEDESGAAYPLPEGPVTLSITVADGVRAPVDSTILNVAVITPLQGLVSATARYVLGGIEVTLSDTVNQVVGGHALQYTIAFDGSTIPSQTTGELITVFPSLDMNGNGYNLPGGPLSLSVTVSDGERPPALSSINDVVLAGQPALPFEHVPIVDLNNGFLDFNLVLQPEYATTLTEYKVNVIGRVPYSTNINFFDSSGHTGVPPPLGAYIPVDNFMVYSGTVEDYFAVNFPDTSGGTGCTYMNLGTFSSTKLSGETGLSLGEFINTPSWAYSGEDRVRIDWKDRGADSYLVTLSSDLITDWVKLKSTDVEWTPVYGDVDTRIVNPGDTGARDALSGMLTCVFTGLNATGGDVQSPAGDYPVVRPINYRISVVPLMTSTNTYSLGVDNGTVLVLSKPPETFPVTGVTANLTLGGIRVDWTDDSNVGVENYNVVLTLANGITFSQQTGATFTAFPFQDDLGNPATGMPPGSIVTGVSVEANVRGVISELATLDCSLGGTQPTVINSFEVSLAGSNTDLDVIINDSFSSNVVQHACNLVATPPYMSHYPTIVADMNANPNAELGSSTANFSDIANYLICGVGVTATYAVEFPGLYGGTGLTYTAQGVPAENYLLMTPEGLCSNSYDDSIDLNMTVYSGIYQIKVVWMPIEGPDYYVVTLACDLITGVTPDNTPVYGNTQSLRVEAGAGATAEAFFKNLEQTGSDVTDPEANTRQLAYAVSVVPVWISTQKFNTFNDFEIGITLSRAERDSVYFADSSLEEVVGCDGDHNFFGMTGPNLSGVRRIADDSFANNYTIQNVIYDSTLECIGDPVFAPGSEIAFTFLGETIPAFDPTAFNGITITSVTVPESVNNTAADWSTAIEAGGWDQPDATIVSTSIPSTFPAVRNMLAKAVEGGVQVTWAAPNMAGVYQALEGYIVVASEQPFTGSTGSFDNAILLPDEIDPAGGALSLPTAVTSGTFRIVDDGDSTVGALTAGVNYYFSVVSVGSDGGLAIITSIAIKAGPVLGGTISSVSVVGDSLKVNVVPLTDSTASVYQLTYSAPDVPRTTLNAPYELTPYDPTKTYTFSLKTVRSIVFSDYSTDPYSFSSPPSMKNWSPGGGNNSGGTGNTGGNGHNTMQPANLTFRLVLSNDASQSTLFHVAGEDAGAEIPFAAYAQMNVPLSSFNSLLVFASDWDASLTSGDAGASGDVDGNQNGQPLVALRLDLVKPYLNVLDDKLKTPAAAGQRSSDVTFKDDNNMDADTLTKWFAEYSGITGMVFTDSILDNGILETGAVARITQDGVTGPKLGDRIGIVYDSADPDLAQGGETALYSLFEQAMAVGKVLGPTASSPASTFMSDTAAWTGRDAREAKFVAGDKITLFVEYDLKKKREYLVDTENPVAGQPVTTLSFTINGVSYTVPLTEESASGKKTYKIVMNAIDG